MPAALPQPSSRFVTAPDGLKLHVRDYGPQWSAALPVVCLPGLTRTAEDFAVLAQVLALAPRRVLALDYRGRGLSAWDPEWKHYDLKVESADILAVLAASGIGRAVFVGTSRGGLNTMLIAALRPGVLAGVVLNDIGPVLEPQGLARIRASVGKLPAPTSWADAVDLLKHVAGAQFPGISEDEWQQFAKLTFQEAGGKMTGRYDPKLFKTLEHLDLEAPLPALWPQFEALAHVPVLVLRGSQSDLLSQATAEEMTRRHPDCALHIVPGQGHAPLLLDAPSIARIAAFVAKVQIDAARDWERR